MLSILSYAVMFVGAFASLTENTQEPPCTPCEAFISPHNILSVPLSEGTHITQTQILKSLENKKNITTIPESTIFSYDEKSVPNYLSLQGWCTPKGDMCEKNISGTFVVPNQVSKSNSTTEVPVYTEGTSDLDVFLYVLTGMLGLSILFIQPIMISSTHSSREYDRRKKYAMVLNLLPSDTLHKEHLYTLPQRSFSSLWCKALGANLQCKTPWERSLAVDDYVQIIPIGYRVSSEDKRHPYRLIFPLAESLQKKVLKLVKYEKFFAEKSPFTGSKYLLRIKDFTPPVLESASEGQELTTGRLAITMDEGYTPKTRRNPGGNEICKDACSMCIHNNCRVTAKERIADETFYAYKDRALKSDSSVLEIKTPLKAKEKAFLYTIIGLSPSFCEHFAGAIDVCIHNEKSIT